MSRTDSTAANVAEDHRGTGGRTGNRGGGREAARPAPGAREPRLLKQYKPEQGKVMRVGTFVGLGTIIAWGAKFLYDRLAVYQGDEVWQLLVTTGIPILFVVVFGGVAWWFVFAQRGTGDFMIATEGEMKKVSWSSKGEVIGSTKVVIMFTVLMALLLFLADLVFQTIFAALGVLKK